MLMCGVRAKSVAVQWEVVKVKFLMNSNIMTLTVLNLVGQGHYDKVKGQIKVTL